LNVNQFLLVFHIQMLFCHHFLCCWDNHSTTWTSNLFNEWLDFGSWLGYFWMYIQEH
jgi:hypothetical protein